MQINRRYFIKQFMTVSSYTIAALWSKPNLAAWLAQDFSHQAITPLFEQLFPDKILQNTNKIQLKLPRVAENGSVVPITITSTIKNVDTVYIFSEKNPVPLIATFTLQPELAMYIGARFKMQETCDVIVILKAKDQYYQARQRVKVTLGGCGG